MGAILSCLRLGLAVIVIALGAAVGLVRAEDASPLRGVFIPAGPVAGDADATAVELNPGQLPFVSAASSALVLSHWGAEAQRPGRGTALMLGTPLVLGASLGVGFHWLRPTLAGEPDGYTKLQLGGGLRLGRGLGLGFSWEHLFGARYGGLDGLSLGLGLRPFRFLAAGVALRDLNEPRVLVGADMVRVRRQWDGEIALRPLGTPRLEVSLGARISPSDTGRFIRPRARLAVGVVRGLTLFAEADTPHEMLDPIDLESTPGLKRGDYRAMLGLHADLGSSTLSAAGVGNWGQLAVKEDRTTDFGGGASFMIRSFGRRRPSVVPLRHVQRLHLRGPKSDRAFLDMVVRLRELSADETVGAIVLEIEGIDLGLARIEELRALIARMRGRKPVFAHLSQPSTPEYYLASACDQILLHPAGGLTLTGLSQVLTFYKGTLDKIGVNVDLVRIAEYKGAMEPFVRTESSDPVRRNRNEILDDQFGRILEQIARGRGPRGFSAQSVRAQLDKALFDPPEAVKAGLADGLADRNQVESLVQQALGGRWAVRDARPPRLENRSWRPSRVAVLLVDGTIVDGGPGGLPLSASELAFADPIVESLEQIRRDPSVRALVLRVNSPGGSAFASDRISREVARVRGAGKPVIVSMGDVAASGGYYVAAGADEILAAPSTITGSIGIYSYKIDMAGLFGRLGLAHEIFKRGEHADLYSPFRPWTESERLLIADRIGYSYRLFLDVVASGRKRQGLTSARVDELGRGRVYTGTQAQPVGLVDRLAGLDVAIEEAARRARVPLGPGGLPEIVVLPKLPPSPIDALLRLRSDGIESSASGSDAQAALRLVERHGRAAARLLLPLVLGNGEGIEARLPYEIEVR